MTQKILFDWFDGILHVSEFDDVSNNGIQIASDVKDVKTVAFAVDASVKNVRAAAAAGAQILVVHHGISWGGGIKRITGGVFNVVKAAMDAGVAVYACHLPLDASRECGNNFEIARSLGMTRLKKAFSYHGNIIGVTGNLADVGRIGEVFSHVKAQLKGLKGAVKLGVCSGGAGDFAPRAKELGCDAYLTGEASWGDVIAAENVGMKMITAGHYETEVFGVRALAKLTAAQFKVKTVDLTEEE